MNNRHIIRAGRPVAATAATVHAPNAALLIDFDNVTLGIRSDLTKELRTLLNSDIIKGKVAVQRAYADWRRYPQYIVPLSESSIDLIFAPAFGTNKKNATDIRLAVDAIELVFTRPEIGTFILLSGDSDFSSMVIKLKEYGKYVIGVGIRESASDLLIQNCDEYYSYSDLAGLTKEEDVPSIQRDPWELVREAAAQMVRNDDVMRSDRLKQVMKQIDPHFDEKNAGYSRFSKFVTDAGAKGILVVNKMENGQYEIAPVAGGVEPPRRGSGAAGQGGRTTAGPRGRG
ncbi:MAG TPA: NYN domain-containing protein, partial [Gemmatimonadales bacterium]|nr:NYN domain-containing protein [Gemmatimonadales bacterium]